MEPVWDAPNFGGQKSVLISLTNVNNEATFNGYSFHSTEENCCPVHIFSGPDSRLNLQLNIGGESGYLNNWIDSMSEKGHKTFVVSDNMFPTALLGGELDPKSSDNFSLYTLETTATRSEVRRQTGLRSECNHQIVCEHPDSLLPAIPTDHLLTLRIMSCLNEGVVNNDKNSTLTKLISNINNCGIYVEVILRSNLMDQSWSQFPLMLPMQRLFQHHLEHLHQHSQTFWMVLQMTIHLPKPFLYISRKLFLGLPVP